jgi:hypothetical protein
MHGVFASMDEAIAQVLLESQLDPEEFAPRGCQHRPDLLTWHCKRCGVLTEMTDEQRAEYAFGLSRESGKPIEATLDGLRGTVFPSGVFRLRKRG